MIKTKLFAQMHTKTQRTFMISSQLRMLFLVQTIVNWWFDARGWTLLYHDFSCKFIKHSRIPKFYVISMELRKKVRHSSVSGCVFAVKEHQWWMNEWIMQGTKIISDKIHTKREHPQKNPIDRFILCTSTIMTPATTKEETHN